MSPSQVNQDPFQGEFFASSADLPSRLVREAIQNSLDARRDHSAPVRVRFVFSGTENALHRGRAAQYLRGLKHHLRAHATRDGRSSSDIQERASIERAISLLDMPMTYLAIEDFGTTGLRGAPEDHAAHTEGNDFCGFFRNVGISTKSEDAGGSWGLGKWVFPDASMVNAYFGLTQRESEDRVLLMGLAMLKTHHIGERKYPPYGYFAAPADQLDHDWLPLPVDSDEDPNIVNTLLDLNLDRLDGPGLSVVVPFPKKELNRDTVARAVLTQYFLPIVRGDLVVEIHRPPVSDTIDRTVIDATTIRAVASRIPVPPTDDAKRDDESPQSLSRAISLAEWAIGRSVDNHLQLRMPISKDSLPVGLSVDDLRERYEQGQRLAFRCEIPRGVQRQGAKSSSAAAFSVYLERADDLEHGHDYFVRGHLRIPNMDYLGNHRSRALIYVESHSELAHLLRDAEGPAHAKWNRGAERLRQRWKAGARRVGSVCAAAAHLLRLLSDRGQDPQLDALADLFPGVPDPDSTRATGTRPGPTPAKPLPVSDIPPSPILLSRKGLGFLIRPSGRPAVAPDAAFTVRFAYDVAHGNAFRAYDAGLAAGTPDFSLKDHTVSFECRGCHASILRPNVLSLTVLEPKDFECLVTGLDGRDVIVRLDPSATATSTRDHDA